MSVFQGQFSISGLSPSTTLITGAWMRDCAEIKFLYDTEISEIGIEGFFDPYQETFHSKFCTKPLKLDLLLDGKKMIRVPVSKEGTFSFKISDLQESVRSGVSNRSIQLRLRGVGMSNFLAFAGRLLKNQGWLPKRMRQWLQPFRRQHNNRQVLLQACSVNGEVLIDLNQAHSVFEPNFILKHSNIGVNVIGWFHGFLGVGESARACARAAKSVNLPVDPVALRLNLNGGQSDALWGDLSSEGSQSITIAHVDAPQSLDLTKQHPLEMASDKYRIGYWAWELPDFPDNWIKYASQFDEIWCPSEFCREAMAAKLPIPVQSMPHSIVVPEVEQNIGFWRDRFGLPQDAYLFLFSFDLNSYSPRKNPEAVIESYRIASKEIDTPVGLVLKMHGKGYDAGERAKLEQLKEELPGVFFVDEMLTREELDGLQFACDSFVSLHRSEGFGLAVAEMMALGKPVISTNWSATSEFVNVENGCPVAYEIIELEANVGPYTKGQKWANPSSKDAAAWMVRLATDQKFSDEIGRNAKTHIQTYYSPEAIGSRYLSRIKSIALF